MQKKVLIPLILVLIALVYHLFIFNHGINLLDEGLLLHGTERMMQGEILYKDVNTIYSPGMYLTSALFFKLFGQTLISVKLD